MGTYYTLANFTLREKVTFARISGMKAGDILANPQGALVAAAYMLAHSNDDVAFVPDDPPFRGLAPYETDVSSFRDVTDDVVDRLVTDGDLTDYGTVRDEDNPEVSWRVLRVRKSIPPPPGSL